MMLCRQQCSAISRAAMASARWLLLSSFSTSSPLPSFPLPSFPKPYRSAALKKTKSPTHSSYLRRQPPSGVCLLGDTVF